MYKNKKSTEPIVVLELGKMAVGVIDEIVNRKTNKYCKTNRNMKLLRLDADGNMVSIYVSAAMNTEVDNYYSPKRLYKEIVENIGYPPPSSMIGHQDKVLITDCMFCLLYTSAMWLLWQRGSIVCKARCFVN